jgi:3'-phosphoadenosine 5'-phosphosulfate sulfotransferase (PAPS reductase)/FAD synthetase
MDIALRIRPDIQIVWHDEDWVLPGTAENIEGVETFYGINIIRVRERFSADEFFKEFGRWPICLSPRSVDFEADHWFEIVRHYGWDGAVIALRSDESTQRYFALKRPLRWNKSREEWRVSPVHDWSVEDIWAYILGRKLPYHPAYEKMIDAGIEPKFARIGPLTAVRVYDYGILTAFKQLWPETWNRFVEENPCVAAE